MKKIYLLLIMLIRTNIYVMDKNQKDVLGKDKELLNCIVTIYQINKLLEHTNKDLASYSSYTSQEINTVKQNMINQASQLTEQLSKESLINVLSNAKSLLLPNVLQLPSKQIVLQNKMKVD
ncbi:MAG: hypothetical protein ACOYT8_05345 [Candidatus Dependentiae bacterium]